MRFGFLLKPGQPDAVRVAGELIEVVRRRGGEAFVTQEDGVSLSSAAAIPAAALGRMVDVLVVLGGDGTFLHGANLVGDHGVPLLGINLGGLGFITHYALTEAIAAVEAVIEGKLSVEERMRLEVSVQATGKATEAQRALNEVVIQRSLGRLLIDLAAELDGKQITTYKADGLILSTPTGSTAYSLAAGGPILTPDVDAMVLTPISPHTLTNRPVVLRADARVKITNVSANPVAVTVDGHFTRELAPGDFISVHKADRPLRSFRAPSTFFAILRQKLSWGERQV